MTEVTPIIQHHSTSPLYAQIYQYFRDEIQAGRLTPHTRLPSVRHLSRSMGVSKMTIETAYHQLLAEGYIDSRERSGFFVASLDLTDWSEQLPALFKPGTVFEPPHLKYDDYQINFHGSVIDVDHFPFTLWRKCLQEALERYPEDFAFYGDNQGEPELREEIARYLRQARTVACDAGQIVLGTGLHECVSLLSLMLRVGHQRVAIEEPGYSNMRMVMEQHGLKVVPVELDEDGINIDQLILSGATAVYVTPAHQYPYGMVMSITKRLKLLQWAKQTGGVILENDYDGEFRYNVKPAPSLQGLDQDGTVVYIGNFSKSLSPALRMNYMVLPAPLLTLYHQQFHIYPAPVPRLQQRALQLFMQKGHWDKHIRRMRKIYEKKHQCLLDAIHRQFANHATVLAQSAGLHILLEMDSDSTSEELAEQAAHAGIKVYTITHTWMNHTSNCFDRPRILLGFGGLSADEIEEGIRLLAELWLA
ncbi:PLP-dependent aminotransferase family protein [Brevibacillus ginsengisoli]|uniref:MocR-like pyridoxine biosynthesis transcription factor PdxR n=1 Tax=Brevibacillus ginsengisoli TaxID=363854 RepID=UPI003CEF202D